MQKTKYRARAIRPSESETKLAEGEETQEFNKTHWLFTFGSPQMDWHQGEMDAIVRSLRIAAGQAAPQVAEQQHSHWDQCARIQPSSPECKAAAARR